MKLVLRRAGQESGKRAEKKVRGSDWEKEEALCGEGCRSFSYGSEDCV